MTTHEHQQSPRISGIPRHLFQLLTQVLSVWVPGDMCCELLTPDLHLDPVSTYMFMVGFSREDVLEAIDPLWDKPAPPVVPPPTRGPPIPATVAHQLDLDTRKAISEAMAALPKVRVTSPRL